MSQENILLNRKILANNLIELRLKSKVKREELSLALGFDNSYISKIEKCKINITLDRLSIIANYFNVSIKDLFKE